MNRRTFLTLSGAAAATLLTRPARADKKTSQSKMIQRKIPRTGEELPAIGLGTWQTFDVSSAEERKPLREVMDAFLAGGGRVVDSSPMYGKAEETVGAVLGGRSATAAFLATKVWTSGREEGERQMKRSLERMGTKTMDLMQVHNLLDWKVHLKTLAKWKDAGTVRYVGVTHYQLGAFDDLAAIMKSEPIDFVQLPYSLATRDAEKRLLPLAADQQIAVLVMRPFEEGALFDRVKGQELPGWAADLDATSWAQVFLKFILGHPAVTCPIPATAKLKHVEDNLRGGVGRLPDESQRKKMVEFFDRL